MKNTLIVAALLAVAALGVISTLDEAQAVDAEKVTIKKVMKAAMKDGLCKKVASGKGDPGDAEKLLEMFTAMSKLEPPRGEADSWKEKTSALVAAAQECVDDKEGAGAKLGAAASCKACHSAHKPK